MAIRSSRCRPPVVSCSTVRSPGRTSPRSRRGSRPTEEAPMSDPPSTSTTSSIAARALRTRWLVRLPIWLYRARLGFLFGRRLLMLEHVGRTSGQPRYVVLEVVDHSPGEYTVCAGFGERTQWLRNLE